jgi:hypothetical protein
LCLRYWLFCDSRETANDTYAAASNEQPEIFPSLRSCWQRFLVESCLRSPEFDDKLVGQCLCAANHFTYTEIPISTGLSVNAMKFPNGRDMILFQVEVLYK